MTQFLINNMAPLMFASLIVVMLFGYPVAFALAASGIFFGLGLGGTVHDGLQDPTDPDKKALGSRILFHIPIEIGLRLDDRRSISVYFEHMSNAFLFDSNEGLDSIGVRYGYKF